MAADTQESISVCQCVWKEESGGGERRSVSQILCFISGAVVLPGRETIDVYFLQGHSLMSVGVRGSSAAMLSI